MDPKEFRNPKVQTHNLIDLSRFTKEEYLKFAEDHEVPITSSPFYLNSFCGDQWNVLKCISQNEVFYFPILVKKKYGLRYITMPTLCLYYDLPETDSVEVNRELISALVNLKTIKTDFSISASFQTQKQLESSGFLTYRKPYFIIQPSDYKAVKERYKSNVKRNLSRANREYFVDSVPPSEALKLIRSTYEKQSINPPYDEKILVRFLKLAVDKNQCFINGAFNQEKKLIASSVFLTDHRFIYYYLSGIDANEQRNAGQTLLIDHAIQIAMNANKTFHFYGSSIPRVAKFMKTFGPEEGDYLVVSKKNPILRSIEKLTQ